MTISAETRHRPVEEPETKECSALNERSVSCPTPEAQGASCKIVRAKGGDDFRRSVFQTQQGSSTYEPTGAVTACLRPAEAQARHNPSKEGEGGHEVPP